MIDELANGDFFSVYFLDLLVSALKIFKADETSDRTGLVNWISPKAFLKGE